MEVQKQTWHNTSTNFDDILRQSKHEDFAETLGSYDGDFLSQLKKEGPQKSLWSQLYFYLIGDPMKTK